MQAEAFITQHHGGVGHAHRMSWRRAGWALLRDRHEAAQPRPRDRGGRAQPAFRHVRLGGGAVGRDAGQPRDRRSRKRRDHPPRIRLLGRHSGVLSGDSDALVGSRVLRHRTQAAPQHPARASTGPGRRVALRDRDRQPRALPRPRSDRGSRRRQFQNPQAPWHTSSSPISTSGPANTSGSAHTRSSTTHSPSYSRRPSTAGSGHTPISSMATPRPSSSSAPRRPGGALVSTA